MVNHNGEDPRQGGSSNESSLAPSASDDAYKVKVSLRFIILSFFVCTLAAFAVGQAARILLIEGPKRSMLVSHFHSPLSEKITEPTRTLPPPIAKEGKPIPNTIYTAKNFDTSRTASSSLLIRRGEEEDASPSQSCASNSCRSTSAPAENEVTAEEDDEEEHLPAGQHLLVDMKGLEAAFLNSEERLAHAMVEVVNEASLTLLSYHCHALLPSGVSCVGVLLESHVSFHTWPSAGVITLDLFTCGNNCLLPVVPIIERLFSIPASPNEKPQIVWSHQLRGFRNGNSSPLSTWDSTSILATLDMEYKEQIASKQTNFQRIDIYDIISARFNTREEYELSLAKDDSYYSQNPDFFSPDRVVLLDGILQSRRKGENAYHESLVHPAMFAHSNPQRVAIVGGGEGATLREVLKHKSVREVVMIEIDQEMVSVSRQYLPEWSDCSDLVGSSDWCGDDKRSTLFYEDAMQWFISRYLDTENIKDELFDVIIMDAIDPNDHNEFSDVLYNNNDYLTSLYNGLSEDGILVAQIGETPGVGSPAEVNTAFKNRSILIEHLSRLGFQTMHVYGQNHGGYHATWNNLLAGKSLTTRSKWYENAAETNLQISQRLVRSKSGSTMLRYFDGSTMERFQLPGRDIEDVFCRQIPVPEDCSHRGFNRQIPNFNGHMLEVKQSTVSESAGRGLFATVDIPKGSYISAESAGHSVHFKPNTYALIEEMELCVTTVLDAVYFYMHGYGVQVHHLGEKSNVVDSSILTFMNHGCNGTYNHAHLGYNCELHEFTADVSKMPDEYEEERSVFSPVRDRNNPFWITSLDLTTRDISAGDELLTNYLAFVGHSSDWKYDLLHLRAQCSGKDVGDVTSYETAQ
mmetsp:Transcript_12427/g.18221  ORF Transcript_12427/g.18221 Transcript_12427/m.18221 type:complete len:859 (-) Transcript_12427:147-2723(-)